MGVRGRVRALARVCGPTRVCFVLLMGPCVAVHDPEDAAEADCWFFSGRAARDRGGSKRKAMEVGPATVERIVNGRYEWRDGGMRPMTGARRAIWKG